MLGCMQVAYHRFYQQVPKTRFTSVITELSFKIVERGTAGIELRLFSCCNLSCHKPLGANHIKAAILGSFLTNIMLHPLQLAKGMY